MAVGPSRETLAGPTDGEFADLETLARAQHARQGLLPESERRRLHHHVKRYETAARSYEAWRAQRRAAQEEVESTASAETGARQALKTLWSVQREPPDDPSPLKDGADEAKRVLLADDAEREPVEDVLEQGRQAGRSLAASLESRVRDCVIEDSLPVWFRVALGEQPELAGRAEAWLDAAVRLLWFRFRYAIIDDLLPCGRVSQLPEAAGVQAAELLAECDRAKGSGQ